MPKINVVLGSGTGNGAYLVSKLPKKYRGVIGSAFDDALVRLLRIKPGDLDGALDEARKDDLEAQKYVEERKKSIRKGARRSDKRFRI